MDYSLLLSAERYSGGNLMNSDSGLVIDPETPRESLQHHPEMIDRHDSDLGSIDSMDSIESSASAMVDDERK